MKKIKSLFLVAAALLIGFSSCNNDNDAPGTGDINYNNTGRVQFHLTLADTRLEGPSQAERPVSIESGTLIFASAAGVIQNVFTIGDDPADETTVAALTAAAGHTFENINATAAQVHFIGNTELPAVVVATPATSPAGAPVIGRNISSVLAYQLDIIYQAGELTDFASSTLDTEQVVNVHGIGNINPPTPAALLADPDAPHTSVVRVEPTVGRIEVHNITGNYTIAGFNVHGIFMDRYYRYAGVGCGLLPGGGVTEATFVYNSNNDPVTGFTDVERIAGFQYPSGVAHNIFPATTPLQGPIFDWFGALGSGRVANQTDNFEWDMPWLPDFEDFLHMDYLWSTRPAGATGTYRHVWGYNLFAEYTNAARTLGSTFPYVIIRLSEVYINRPMMVWEYEEGYEPFHYVWTHVGPGPGDYAYVWTANPNHALVSYSFPYNGGMWLECPTGEWERALHPLHGYNEVSGVKTNPYLFLTIRGFQVDGAPLTTGFLPRRVYQIGTDLDIENNGGWFGKEDITTAPNMAGIDVNVRVIAMPWINVSGRPTF